MMDNFILNLSADLIDCTSVTFPLSVFPYLSLCISVRDLQQWVTFIGMN